jgi:hypothetical protein
MPDSIITNDATCFPNKKTISHKTGKPIGRFGFEGVMVSLSLCFALSLNYNYTAA